MDPVTASAALGDTGASADPIELRRRFQRILKEKAERGREDFIMESVFAPVLGSYETDADVARIGRLFRQLSLTALTLGPYVVPTGIVRYGVGPGASGAVMRSSPFL